MNRRFLKKLNLESNLKELKKVVPEISGTKLCFMLMRYEKEGVYMYI